MCQSSQRLSRSLIALCAVGFCSVAAAGFGDLLKSASEALQGGAPPNATTAPSLSNTQIGAGLKQALNVGAERAVAVLGRSGGFLNDASVRIPLPGVLETVAKGLRAAGQGQYVDQFEQTVNRAAEQAIPKTLDIVQQTVQSMTLDDVRGILAGGDDAATQFLRQRAGDSLHAAIKPIVAQATDEAGATAAYKRLAAQSGDMLGSSLGQSLGGLGGLFGGAAPGATPASLDLDEYVTGKALDGLFLKLAAEESAIRHNPLARSTELLKQVFSN